MGKRGRDLEMCRDVQRCRMGIIPNPHGVGINWEGYLRSEKPQPRPDTKPRVPELGR